MSQQAKEELLLKMPKDNQPWQATAADIQGVIATLHELKGTSSKSCCTLIIPPGDHLKRVQKILIGHEGIIDPRVVANPPKKEPRATSYRKLQFAVRAAVARLELWQKSPANGLVLFFGYAVSTRRDDDDDDDDDDIKQQLVDICFEPFAPIGTSLLLEDTRFHTEDLEEFLAPS